MYIGRRVQYPLFLSHLMILEFSRKILEKYSNIKFNENPSSGSRDVPYGQTDRHDEANSRFSQVCERAQNLLIPLPGFRQFKECTSHIISSWPCLMSRG